MIYEMLSSISELHYFFIVLCSLRSHGFSEDMTGTQVCAEPQFTISDLSFVASHFMVVTFYVYLIPKRIQGGSTDYSKFG